MLCKLETSSNGMAPLVMREQSTELLRDAKQLLWEPTAKSVDCLDTSTRFTSAGGVIDTASFVNNSTQ